MSAVAPARRASPTRNSSLRALLPPPASPVRSSRLTKMRGHRAGPPSASRSRAASCSGVGSDRQRRGGAGGPAPRPGRFGRSSSGSVTASVAPAAAASRRSAIASAASSACRSVGGSACTMTAAPVRGCAKRSRQACSAWRAKLDGGAVQARVGNPPAGRAAIHGVADQRPATIGQVHAQLVRPAGDQPAAQQRGSAVPAPRARASVRYSVTAIAPPRARHHPPAVERVCGRAAPRSGRRAGAGRPHTRARYSLVNGGALQRGLHLARLGHQQQPRRALVETLHEVRLPARRRRARPARAAR